MDIKALRPKTSQMLWYVPVLLPFNSAPQLVLMRTNQIDWNKIAAGKPMDAKQLYFGKRK